MRSAVFLGAFFLCVQHLSGQISFKQFEKVRYKRLAFVKTGRWDSAALSTAYVEKLPSLQGIRIDVQRAGQWLDSSHIAITRQGEPLLQFSVPSSWIEDSFFVADLDHDGRLDIKFIIGGSGEWTRGIFIHQGLSFQHYPGIQGSLLS